MPIFHIIGALLGFFGQEGVDRANEKFFNDKWDKSKPKPVAKKCPKCGREWLHITHCKMCKVRLKQ